jgi:amidophosphoribosyltransferase
MSIVHNGNLTNAKEIRADLIKSGAIFQSSMDTENLAHFISRSDKEKLKDRIIDAVKAVKGAYSFIFLSRSKMFAIRDAHGFRPLVLGRIGKDGWMVASETCALDLAGAKYIREIEPGEMLIFDTDKEPQSLKVFEAVPKKCVFEHVYFARPDSNLFGMSAYTTRVQMGRYLSHEMPVEADMVIPVPDSGVPSALGYAKESGIDFELGIIRNHYVGRTFIEPAQEVRDLKVRMKLSPIKELISGKRLIVVDDSIVRGTTSKQIVRMLKDAGAKEVHMRISSPPTSDPCYYGIDTPDKSHLISSSKTVADVGKYIGADSLAYLSVPNLIKSVYGEDDSFCTACFSGNYPV